MARIRAAPNDAEDDAADDAAADAAADASVEVCAASVARLVALRRLARTVAEGMRRRGRSPKDTVVASGEDESPAEADTDADADVGAAISPRGIRFR